MQSLLRMAQRPVGAIKRRFSIERLEERVAPSAGLLDVNLAFNVVLIGPLNNVHLTIHNVYLTVQNNVIQASAGGTLTGAVG